MQLETTTVHPAERRDLLPRALQSYRLQSGPHVRASLLPPDAAKIASTDNFLWNAVSELAVADLVMRWIAAILPVRRVTFLRLKLF